MPYSEKQIAELDAGMWAYEALKRADSGEQSLESAARTLIAAVRKETREECARDAERYRWLRENTYVEAYWIDGAGGVDTKIRLQGSVHFLDEAIDKELGK